MGAWCFFGGAGGGDVVGILLVCMYVICHPSHASRTYDGPAGPADRRSNAPHHNPPPPKKKSECTTIRQTNHTDGVDSLPYITYILTHASQRTYYIYKIHKKRRPSLLPVNAPIMAPPGPPMAKADTASDHCAVVCPVLCFFLVCCGWFGESRERGRSH